MEFRRFTEADYDAVCEFLIALNRIDRRHINWNWARFEWMYEHPEFDKSLRSSIGLWLEDGAVVGAAIYDMYFGEAFCGVLPAHRALYPEVLRYAWETLRDESGLGVAICEWNAREIEAAEHLGFLPAEQEETVMRLELDRLSPAPLPAGFRFICLDPVKDARALQWLFWQGFDHGQDEAEFERQDPVVPRVRKHFDPALGVAAAGPDGAPAAICCLWYQKGTDYAYVEPVCTVPAQRGKGVGRAVVTEALRRAKALGAQRAYVISDQLFYEKLGFDKAIRFPFYRRDADAQT